MCVCVYIYMSGWESAYIYIYIYMCVCVCLCVCPCAFTYIIYASFRQCAACVLIVVSCLGHGVRNVQCRIA